MNTLTTKKPVTNRKIRRALLKGTKNETKQYVIKTDKTCNVDVTKALNAFLNTNETKARFGQHYFIQGNKLAYRSVITERKSLELKENVIALKINGMILGNSSVLPLIGRTVNWGNENENRSETEVQRRLSAAGVMLIPFTVFEQAKLDLNQFQLVDKGSEESITRKRSTGKYDKVTDKEIFIDETVHFTGSSLFKVGYETFLFDIDRREIEHKVFNPFLVNLTKEAKTISEAYEGLKPDAVKDAELGGLTVRRQGEWFFIPVTRTESSKYDLASASRKPITLRAGNNRPNQTTGLEFNSNGELITDNRRNVKGNGYVVVTGKVSHSGREHADLILKGWYRAIPNTATRSFTITGDID